MAKNLTVDVGSKLRYYRKKNRLSLEELSRRSGVAATNLSSIELNKSSPTLSTLIKIAGAFGKKVNFFLEDVLFEEAAMVKKAERKKLKLPGFRANVESLGTSIIGQKMRPYFYNIEADSDSGFERITNEGDTFIYLMDGQMEFRVGDNSYHMKSGDSLYIMAEQSFSWKNVGDKKARIIIVIGVM